MCHAHGLLLELTSKPTAYLVITRLHINTNNSWSHVDPNFKLTVINDGYQNNKIKVIKEYIFLKLKIKGKSYSLWFNLILWAIIKIIYHRKENLLAFQKSKPTLIIGHLLKEFRQKMTILAKSLSGYNLTGDHWDLPKFKLDPCLSENWKRSGVVDLAWNDPIASGWAIAVHSDCSIREF